MIKLARNKIRRYLKQRTGDNCFYRFLRRLKFHLPVYPRFWKGRKLPSIEEAGRLIADALCSPAPIFVTRVGWTEGDVMLDSFMKQEGLASSFRPFTIRAAKRQSGIFPTSESYLQRFAELYFNAACSATHLAIWDVGMERMVLESIDHPVIPVPFAALYPLKGWWSSGLKGHRVLIISPFAKTIEKQYYGPHRNALFQDKTILPDFKLLTYAPVVSLATEEVPFQTWEDALFHMFSEISEFEESFDVCLLSCGAYGLPLGEMIFKKLNKKVIHVGGSLQLLFGIKGAAYEKDKSLSKYMNEYWVYPSAEETPKNIQGVDGGAYWAPQGERQ